MIGRMVNGDGIPGGAGSRAGLFSTISGVGRRACWGSVGGCRGGKEWVLGKVKVEDAVEVGRAAVVGVGRLGREAGVGAGEDI